MDGKNQVRCRVTKVSGVPGEVVLSSRKRGPERGPNVEDHDTETSIQTVGIRSTTVRGTDEIKRRTLSWIVPSLKFVCVRIYESKSIQFCLPTLNVQVYGPPGVSTRVPTRPRDVHGHTRDTHPPRRSGSSLGRPAYTVRFRRGRRRVVRLCVHVTVVLRLTWSSSF